MALAASVIRLAWVLSVITFNRSPATPLMRLVHCERGFEAPYGLDMATRSNVAVEMAMKNKDNTILVALVLYWANQIQGNTSKPALQ